MLKKIFALGLISVSSYATSSFALNNNDNGQTSNDIHFSLNAISDEDRLLPSFTFPENNEPQVAGFNVTVNNHSNRRACVTIIEADPQMSRGWYVLENGSSRVFYGLSYIRAEECGNTGIFWNPGWDMQNFCVKYGDAFNFYTPSNAQMCQSVGGVMKLHYRVPSTYNWTLNW